MTRTRETQPGYITIARHGEPDADRRVLLSWRDYERWWDDYDEAGLKPGQAAPEALKLQAAEAKTIIASTLPRAMETAKAAADGREIVFDPDFVEAPLPPPNLPGRYRSKTWGVFARSSWWLGHSRGKESRHDAEQRAELAAKKLVEAAQAGPVVCFAHGWFNRMLRPELKRAGYRCVIDGGDWYWSWRRYEYRGETGERG